MNSLDPHTLGAPFCKNGDVPEDSEQLLIQGFDQAATPLALIDVYGQVVLANQEFWNLFGYASGSVVDVGMGMWPGGAVRRSAPFAVPPGPRMY